MVFVFFSIFGILIFFSTDDPELIPASGKVGNETFVSRHTFIYSIRRKKQGKNILQQRYVYQLVRFPKKTTPDYLPIYKETKDNKYDRYNEEILETETTFIKNTSRRSSDNQVEKTLGQTVHIPVIVYDRTVLQQNGKTLTDYEVTDIGTPIVKQQKESTSSRFIIKRQSISISFFLLL